MHDIFVSNLNGLVILSITLFLKFQAFYWKHHKLYSILLQTIARIVALRSLIVLESPLYLSKYLIFFALHVIFMIFIKEYMWTSIQLIFLGFGFYITLIIYSTSSFYPSI